MAAAIIPIVTAAAPLIIPLIKDLVANIQNMFGHNNGTGQTKAETVVDAVMAVVTKLSAAGKIPGVMDPATIASMVEMVVQQMKADGALPSDGKPTVAPLTPTPGQVITGQTVTAGTLSGLPVTIVGVMAIGGK